MFASLVERLCSVGVGGSAFDVITVFLLPIIALAKLANVLVAVVALVGAAGVPAALNAKAGSISDVVLRRAVNTLVSPSEAEFVGDGVALSLDTSGMC